MNDALESNTEQNKQKSVGLIILELVLQFVLFILTAMIQFAFLIGRLIISFFSH